ncbi:uncharacterized protein LACBIDRAFT_314427 [Laccaria bicolor S238N-H82]|uniref:Predicted protein n=1 Tax=Laccaria bicolor (strain S238N-H82 / ATCC MYA-4686) TaxID=486041 RepID=B0DYJ0_LACBS|nr:uncharacterized protein LACBIDRAFT_314427 [Laccaria bicolor S238N-H82]EDR00301.1 predicted protein [Laccaria bicolor S238N-H82]|eukprot:XP_001889053.1 predicted protein [Laccaria bicolor S238N-H82]
MLNIRSCHQLEPPPCQPHLGDLLRCPLACPAQVPPSIKLKHFNPLVVTRSFECIGQFLVLGSGSRPKQEIC